MTKLIFCLADFDVLGRSIKSLSRNLVPSALQQIVKTEQQKNEECRGHVSKMSHFITPIINDKWIYTLDSQ